MNPTDVPTLQDVDAQKGSNPEPNSRCERDNREPVNEGAHRKLPSALLSSLVNALNILHGESYQNRSASRPTPKPPRCELEQEKAALTKVPSSQVPIQPLLLRAGCHDNDALGLGPREQDLLWLRVQAFRDRVHRPVDRPARLMRERDEC